MKRIYIKEEACIGCHLCEVYCQIQHAPSHDPLKAFPRGSGKPLPRLSIEVKKPVSFSAQCRQCAEPSCVYACLTGALRKSPDNGIITLDSEKCIGCWTCLLACPFGAVKQDKTSGKSLKCDLCPGEAIPACVANCPNEALQYVEAE